MFRAIPELRAEIRAAHDAILHPHFTCISTTGAHSDRASYLHEWRTGFDPEVITYWDMRDQRIMVIGDMAVVRAATQWVRVLNGEAKLGMTRYTDTYVPEAQSRNKRTSAPALLPCIVMVVVQAPPPGSRSRRESGRVDPPS